MKTLKLKNLTLSFLLIANLGCGSGGGSSENDKTNPVPLNISVNDLKFESYSYENQSISIESNYSGCSFEILNDDLHHLSSPDGIHFEFRNPIIYQEQINLSLNFRQVSSNCPSETLVKEIVINKYPTEFSEPEANICK